MPILSIGMRELCALPILSIGIGARVIERIIIVASLSQSESEGKEAECLLICGVKVYCCCRLGPELPLLSHSGGQKSPVLHRVRNGPRNNKVED